MTEFKTELDKFDPKIAELQKIVEVSSKIVVSDLKDKNQLALVKAKRIELKGLRVQIEKQGKSLRDDANAFNKAVLKKQHEMVGVIEPEEKRLSAIEEETSKLLEIEKRKLNLPSRKERLEKIGDDIKITDEEILEMEDIRFHTYLNERTSEWNAEQVRRFEAEKEIEAKKKEELAKAEAEARGKELLKERELKEKEEAERVAREKEAQAKIDAEKAKIEEEKRKLEAKKREIEHQKELEIARKKAEEEAEILAKIKAEKLEREKEEKEAIEKAKKEAEEKALIKRKAFQEFLSKNGYSEKTKADFHLKDEETKVTLYKKVGVFNK